STSGGDAMSRFDRSSTFLALGSTLGLLLAAGSLLASGRTAGHALPPDTVARVNGVPIRTDEYRRALEGVAGDPPGHPDVAPPPRPRSPARPGGRRQRGPHPHGGVPPGARGGGGRPPGRPGRGAAATRPRSPDRRGATRAARPRARPRPRRPARPP